MTNFVKKTWQGRYLSAIWRRKSCPKLRENTHNMFIYPKIQYISQGDTVQAHLDHLARMLDAGLPWLQLRLKNAPEIEVFRAAETCKKMFEPYQAILCINDKPQVAKAVEAQALHLGLDDMPVAEARQIVGPDTIIGGTANTLAHVQQRLAENCQYIGLGPYRHTNTKAKLSPILGLEGYKNIIENLKPDQQKTPIYAIGGLQMADIQALYEAGIYGLALSGLLTNSPKPELLVQEILK
jgi:thiamine-phosphate pyrophosphorylase